MKALLALVGLAALALALAEHEAPPQPSVLIDAATGAALDDDLALNRGE